MIKSNSNITNMNEDIISIHSDFGQKLFQKNLHCKKLLRMINYFEPQMNGYYCGPASAACVINSISGKKNSQRKKLDPSLYDTIVNNNIGLSQQTFLNNETEKIKSQSLICEKGNPNNGIQIRELAEFIKAWGVNCKTIITTTETENLDIRQLLTTALSSDDEQKETYVVANFCADFLNIGHCGHISPVAAYDTESDLALILDVNPGLRPWFWIKLDTLISAMKTFDVIENRGFLIISEEN